MRNPGDRKESGPGVPEAVPRGLQDLLARYGAAALDRIWVFPPLVSGRRESGLLVASVFAEGPEEERRILVSSPYTAERTGKGLRIERSVQEQGEAPADRFPRVVEGVVRRAEKDLGEPREVVVGGVEASLLEILDDYPRELLDPGLPPLAGDPLPDAPAQDGGEEAGVGPEDGGVEAPSPPASPPVSALAAGEAP